MCGIFGIAMMGGAPVDLSHLRGATASLRHRGPDDEGYLLAEVATKRTVHAAGPDTDPTVGLPSIGQFNGQRFDLAFGFRRLSILDLSPTGHQPMSSPDGRLHMVFNGELYNYVELADQLRSLGHRFRGHADSEVLLAAYAQWGAEALSKFVGMFAVAIYDAARSTLFLARDFFGIKPLYYVPAPGFFAFASEIEPLLELPGVSRRPNADRVLDYLRHSLTDHGGETLLADVRQVAAAHCLDVSLRNGCVSEAARPRRYWRIEPGARSDLSFDDAAARLRDLFIDSVRLHLRSDVPVGTCLSGGIDSSSIAMVMRRLEPSAEIHAFSYCADDDVLGEERWVDLVGEAAGLIVHKTRIEPDHLQRDLDGLMHAQDEPFGTTSIYAQHCVFRLAHQHGIKVMLDGQGADEMLAGYRSYLSARLASLIRQWRWGEALRFRRSVASLPGMNNVPFLSPAGGMLLPRVFHGAARKMLGKEKVPPWLARGWFVQRGVDLEFAPKPRRKEAMLELLLESFNETSLPMLLRFEDRNSMHHSIESRVPFLTPALAEFVFSLPEEYLVAPDGTSKAVFRRAMRGIVPDAILDRRDKIGFATPEARWLPQLAGWVDSFLQSETARRIRPLNLGVARREWADVVAGRRPFDSRVWRWLNLIHWAERFNVPFDGH